MDEDDTLLVGFRKKDRTADNAMAKQLKLDLQKALSTLTERELGVLSSRFGLDNRSPQSLEAVAKSFNVTRERIRQIEVRAFRKLHRRSIINNLSPYLEGIGENSDEYEQI